MNDAMLYGLLIYGGAALMLALAAVVVQAVFVSMAARMGSYLLASVPALALGAGAIGVALSKRNLQLNELYGGASGEGIGALWVTRIANLVLLAIAVGKLAQMLFAQRDRTKLWARSEEQSANRRLFSAFLLYAFCSLVLPMVFSAQPTFSHEGLIAVPMFAAAYLARGEQMSSFVTATKWTLLLIMLASLVFAAAIPHLAVSKYASGLIPGFSFRLWGLTSHPNYMGALAISLMLMLWLSPSPKRWFNAASWTLALLSLILTQSKTNWLASLVAFGAIIIYRRGRDSQGRVRIGVWISLLLGTALLATGVMFIDVGTVLTRFLDSDAGTGLTTFTGRTKVWEVAVNMWFDSPWFGYGPNAWSPLHRMQLGAPFATQAHKQLLQALSEGGLAYAVPMLIYFVLLGRAALRSAEWTGGVSVAFFLVIAIRCVSEAPFGIGNMTSGDTVLHMLLFMTVVSEARQPWIISSRQRTPKQASVRPAGVALEGA